MKAAIAILEEALDTAMRAKEVYSANRHRIDANRCQKNAWAYLDALETLKRTVAERKAAKKLAKGGES